MTVRRLESVHRRDIFDFVMYYIYGQSGPSLLIESTDSMILSISKLVHSTIIIKVYYYSSRADCIKRYNELNPKVSYFNRVCMVLYKFCLKSLKPYPFVCDYYTMVHVHTIIASYSFCVIKSMIFLHSTTCRTMQNCTD